MASTFLNDMVNDALSGKSVVPQTIATATTTNGTGVDLLSADGPCWGLYNTGDCGDATLAITIKLQESDDNSTNWTDIAGATVALAASATANDNLSAFLPKGIRSKRYVRAVVITSGGGTLSCPIAVSILSRLKITGSGGGFVS